MHTIPIKQFSTYWPQFSQLSSLNINTTCSVSPHTLVRVPIHVSIYMYHMYATWTLILWTRVTGCLVIPSNSEQMGNYRHLIRKWYQSIYTGLWPLTTACTKFVSDKSDGNLFVSNVNGEFLNCWYSLKWINQQCFWSVKIETWWNIITFSSPRIIIVAVYVHHKSSYRKKNIDSQKLFIIKLKYGEHVISSDHSNTVLQYLKKNERKFPFIIIFF